MTLVDENAFGILVVLYDLESVEYSIEEEPFLEYLDRFHALVEEYRAAVPLAEGVRTIALGHGSYFEFASGDQCRSPIAWCRELRAKLNERDIPNVCIVSAGGRWLSGSNASEVGAPEAVGRREAASTGYAASGSTEGVSYGPSEPLRKALAAEALAEPLRLDGNDEVASGWGPGLYIEKEAIEQEGKSLKNTPTALPVLTSVFYRIGG